jgi:hypothetical protein
MRRVHLGTLAVVLLLLVAGCSGAAPGGGDDVGLSGGAGGDGGAADAAGDPEPTAAPANDDAAERAGSAAVAQENRAIIRTGSVSLTVDSYGNASDRIASLARERGGYVATTERATHGEENRTWTSGRIVIRVPSETFGESFETVQTFGEVEESTADTQDVTEQLVDIEARLETLRTERDRLRELYEEANDTETVLRVSEELSEVQTEIERLTARKRTLENRVAYSTITVELRERPPETLTPTPSPGYADTGLGEAFLASVDGVVTATKALAVTVAYALPYLLAFGLPVGALGFVALRRR